MSKNEAEYQELERGPMVMASQYGARKGAKDVLSSERERTLAMAVRRRASSVYNIERAFEEIGCSCNPYRDRLKQLEDEYNAERQRLLDSLEHSELARELKNLRQKIAELDRKEHPYLDAQGRQAYYFLGVWMLDKVREGSGDILGLSDQEISRGYAQAWIGGWRPRALSGQKQLYEPS